MWQVQKAKGNSKGEKLFASAEHKGKEEDAHATMPWLLPFFTFVR